MTDILFLMSDTGGGHRASAEALMAGFEADYPGRFRLRMVDMWADHTPWPINRVPGSYPFLVNRTPWLWRLMWHASAPGPFRHGMLTAAGAAVRGRMSAALVATPADLVVSVHPLLQAVPERLLRRAGSQVPFVTVVTDLASAHPTWFHPPVARCFVPSREAWSRATAAGLTEGRLRHHGLPVRLEFALDPPARPEMRRRLGLDPNLPMVLLVGGGEGMGPLYKVAVNTAQALAHPGAPAAQMAVVAGRNASLRAHLQSAKWPLPVRVLGFVDAMADWMAAADAIVTKAGPGTIAEAMTRGLPIALYSYIPGQEEGNVPFVARHHIGAYEPDPERLGQLVAAWLGPQADAAQRMGERARSLAQPHATRRIVADLADLLHAQADRRVAGAVQAYRRGSATVKAPRFPTRGFD